MMLTVFAYIVGIVAVNTGFAHVPLVPIFGTGEMWPPLSIAVGLILVLRDFAQREIGHKIWLAMLVGCGLSYWMAAPYIALASAAAFIVAESFDWAVFTFTKRPLADRVLWSSVVSGPVDSTVFLVGAGFFGWWGLLAMSLSKLIAAIILWRWLRTKNWRCALGLHDWREHGGTYFIDERCHRCKARGDYANCVRP